MTIHGTSIRLTRLDETGTPIPGTEILFPTAVTFDPVEEVPPPLHDPCPTCGAEVREIQATADSQDWDLLADRRPDPLVTITVQPCGHIVHGYSMECSTGRVYDIIPGAPTTMVGGIVRPRSGWVYRDIEYNGRWEEGWEDGAFRWDPAVHLAPIYTANFEFVGWEKCVLGGPDMPRHP